MIYSSRPNLMIGFHGCDESVRNELVTNPNKIKKSKKNLIGSAMAFTIWENNYERALKWSKDKFKRGKITAPSVVVVIYQLDYCLDFTDSQFIDILAEYYQLFKSDLKFTGKTIPKNKMFLKIYIKIFC